uniref:CAS_C domain-containing protein n=1 Tax=Angiostrongylus cantonensis TaxID=6313 RepID=A0A0K0DE56_ANGCA
MEEAVQSRKRIVCSKMSENLRRIENACAQINKITAPQHWRAPHLLQTNLSTLRDSATTAHEALEMFVDGTARISVDRRNPKSEEFDELLKPLLAARSHISNLRKNLDADGWTVSVLSRDGENPRTVDSLDQFITAFQKVPADCRRLLQWTQLLVPSSTIIFLSPLASNKVETSAPIPLSHPRIPDRLAISLGSPPFMEETKRLSSSSTSTVTSSDSSQPSSILVTKHNGDKPKGRVTFADELCDRPSVSSLHDSNSAYSKRSPNRDVAPNGPAQLPIHRLQETRIIEEDDLESVVSDRESLYQDYAYLDDTVPGRSNAGVDNTVNNGISDEDRQLARFYAPQLDQHIESLSLAVEDFLGTVENNLPPRDFVQKGKLIILAAHKLIYIGDTVSQCVSDRAVSLSLRQCADRLCELLKECVKAMKLASEEYPELKSMQGMIDSIIAVSKTAHEMKMLVKQWC